MDVDMESVTLEELMGADTDIVNFSGDDDYEESEEYVPPDSYKVRRTTSEEAQKLKKFMEDGWKSVLIKRQ
jgi:hypothetical protein